MSLTAGSRLGPHEVLSPLGAGGMGEVWKAWDARLEREVAIKVLPADLAGDPSRLKRFEKEARSASALNHPNIVTVYDIGQTDSVSWIAMELVDGRTLRDVLAAGALPVRRLLQIAAQIADGLARAHEAGIVHRDLKPDNVMVTRDGLVKVLDFGLAKLSQPEIEGGRSAAATMTQGTEPGVVMGTAGYMSPEQASAKAVDYRSDQFAFGAILYEMATGRRAFEKKTAVETLSMILNEEPVPIAQLNPAAPAPLRWITERCLAKAPEERYASTQDLARDLATLRDRLSETTSAVAVLSGEPATMRGRRWRIVAAIVAAALVVAGIVGRRLQQRDYFWENPLAGARFTRFTDWEGSETDTVISRDRQFVVFASDRSGPLDIWLGQVGGGTFLNLSRGKFAGFGGGTRARSAGFSADGSHVWFSVDPKSAGTFQLWLVPTIGGAPRLFLPQGVEATWSPDGSQIAYFFPPGDPIFIADKNGANPTRILTEKMGFHNHYLTWSPDGRFIYFVRGIPPDDMDVWRIRPSGGEPERITRHHGRVAYPVLLDARTLVYCTTREDGGWGLYAIDVERRLPHAVTSGLEEYTSVSASEDGRRLAVTVANPVRNLWAAPISDRLVVETGISRFDLPTMRASAPRYGSDYLLYLSAKGGAQGLWKLKDGSDTELWKGSEAPVPFAPGISSDGAQIAFVTRIGGRHYLSVMTQDGTDVHRIAESLDVIDPPSWSPDGQWIAVVAREGDGRARPLYKVPVDGGPPVLLVEGVNSDPVWSPDGRMILYSEGRGGNSLLRAVTPDKQMVPLPEIAVPYAGNRYRFLPDGKSVVFIAELVNDEKQPMEFFLLDLASGRTRQLTSLRPGFSMTSFDVSPDGKQILFDRYRENADVVLIDLQR